MNTDHYLMTKDKIPMNETSILIVEDEAIVAADLAQRVAQFGYKVVGTAARGAVAVTLTRELRPDLILMDIHLTGSLDGIETAEQIRLEFDVPIIFLTAHSDNATLERAKLSGPSGYILKPFQTRELEISIQMGLHKHKTEEALRKSEERHRLLSETMLQGVLHQDATGRIIAMNPAAERILGKTCEQLRGSRSPHEAQNTLREDGTPFLGADHPSMVALRTGQSSRNTIMRIFNPQRNEGRWISIDSVPVCPPGHAKPTEVYTVFEDITERKQAEEQIARLTRLYAVLSRVNEAIVRIQEETELYAEICRIITEECQYPLVWIGEVRGRHIRPIATSGSARGYVDEIKVEIDGPLGQGPGGTAIREGKAVINDDFSVNPMTWSWRELALKWGFRACAAFPLFRQGQPVGVLALYATLPCAFDAEQVRLLEALSADVSFALDRMALERSRADSVLALRKAHDQALWLGRLPSENPDPILRVAFDGEVLYRNAATGRRAGWQYEEGEGLSASPLRSLFQQAVLQNQNIEQYIELGGRFYAVTVALFPEEAYANLYGRDVTEQRLAEQREREAAALTAASRTAVNILNAMGEGVLLLDMQGRVVSANPAIEKMIPIPAGEVIGRDIRTLLPRMISPEDLAVVENGMVAALKGRPRTLPPFTLVNSEGSALPVSASVAFVPDLNNQPRQIVATLRDISELQAMSDSLAESERKYRELVENANSIIMRVTPDRTIAFFNEYAQTFFGYSEDDVLGKNVVGTIVPEIDSEGHDMRNMVDEVMNRLERDGSNDNENICKDGRRVWVHWSSRAVRDETGRLVEILCVGTDLTQRKQLEADAARYQKRLRELAERLAASEEEDRWRISRYIHDTVIQNLSLSSIKLGGLRNSLEKAGMSDELSKLNTTRTLIEKAAAECRSVMSDLTPALLYDLGLIPALRELADKVYAQHNVHIHLDEGGENIPMNAPLRGLLFQSIRELVMNALKHSGESDMRISVEQLDSQIVVQVQDKGKGFDPTNLNRRREGKGGFGLFSVRERVEGLGGRLEIESIPGQGTTARIVVPHTGGH